jgi:hypothetical protein
MDRRGTAPCVCPGESKLGALFRADTGGRAYEKPSYCELRIPCVLTSEETSASSILASVDVGCGTASGT